MPRTEAGARLDLPTRLRIRLARARRWEFWPGWLFYLPVIGWIVLLGLRHRHFTAFTAANPGFDNGSVVGERKSVALLALQARHPQHLPLTRKLPAATPAALAAVDALAAQQGWPLVLKPDIGQRGRGVAIVHGREEAAAYLRQARFTVLAQAYAAGAEYGVFVMRKPGRAEFEISSIVHKVLPTLVGDGVRTLGALILADARARLIAPQLYARHAQSLDTVPAAGERVHLVELGAHCRGAEFRSAMELDSPALLATMQQIADAVPGFAFGRIDLRCPDAEALRAGRELAVLEINGVTSEPAHYYQPGTPLRRAWAGFCAHWSRAFALGREQLREPGVRAIAPLRLLALFREDLRRFDACEAAAGAARAARARGTAPVPGAEAHNRPQAA